MLSEIDLDNLEKIRTIFYYEGTNVLLFWENNAGELLKVEDIEENEGEFNLFLDDPNNDGIWTNENEVIDLIKLINEDKGPWKRIRIYQEKSLDDFPFNNPL